MNIDLSLNEYGIDTEELAGITAMNILEQIGLKVFPRDVKIEDFDLFQSKIPEIIKNTRFTVDDYTPVDYTSSDVSVCLNDEVVNDNLNPDLSETELTIRLFFSRPEYQEIEQAYQIQEMTSEGRFIYRNGKTSEYDSTLLDYIYKNLLEYYSSHYKLEDILLDINNNHAEISVYVLTRILASIEAGVYNDYGFSCSDEEYNESRLLNIFLDEIKQLTEQWEGEAPLNILTSNMREKYNVDSDKTNDLLKQYLQKGLIYQPRIGYYKTI